MRSGHVHRNEWSRSPEYATTIWLDQSSMVDPADVDANDVMEAAGKIAASTDSGICLECLLSAAAAGATTVIRE